MKKLFLTLSFILSFNSFSFAAVSSDVYLRQDVFEAKMDAFMAEVRLGNEQIRREIDKRFSEVDKRFNEVDKQFSEVDKRFTELNARIDLIDERTDSTKTTVYWILAILAAIVALPSVQRLLQWHEMKLQNSAPAFTLDDIKKLINDAIIANNLTLQGK